MGNSGKRRAAFSVGVLLLGLLASATAFAAAVVRGPYLQLQTDDAITVRWRTDIATDSVVRYGTAVDNLDQAVSVPGSTTEHRVRLEGLPSGQQYYYSVGDSIAPLAGDGDASFHFRTAPPPGAPEATRIWVIGDSGTADANAAAVRDAYVAWAGANPADFWLMLGDNAYNDGTDAEYQAAVFNTYPEILRQLPLWATLGNHDGHSADSGTQSGPYYDIFELPTAGEAGGLASGTEAYYSFDYANIHFICLDSYDTSRAPGGAMLSWLEADLAMNDQPWVIAFWHHPPYTKGSHNSDTEGALIDMRQNALPLLESWGVDLVMTGHSHSYERSYLLDGHYGVSATFDPLVHALDAGDGRETGDGAYEKPDIVAAQNEGAVYAVAGSSGKISGGSLNHPAMFLSLNSLGSLVLDVSGNRLDAVFINQAGAVLDEFSIVKSPDADPPLLTGAAAEDANHVLVSFSEPVDSVEAENAANYTIGGLAVSQAELLAGERGVRLTTDAMANGATYTLSVSNLSDLAGNVILPGSSVDFDYFDTMLKSFQDGLAPDPSYAGTRDAYIRQASATTAHGLETTLQVDGDDPSGSGNDMNILLAWDVSAIPPGAVVIDAGIELQVTNPSSGSYTCYALQRGWIEAETTWNQAASSTPWETPGAAGGADRGGTALCTVTAGVVGPLAVPLNAAGIAAVQAWVDNPAGNHGLLIGNPATTDGADFHARESGDAMARPRLNVTYSVVAPPPNEAPTADFTFACTDLACTFTDASIDADGTVVSWSWDFGDGNSSTSQNPSHGYAAAGSYAVSLTVTDDDGATDSVLNSVSVTEPPAFIDQFAEADLPGAGTVSGTYADTKGDDEGNVQSITERESGGKKNERYSYLSHTWSFTVAPGSAVTLYANAWSGGSSDGDAFRFAWSSDNVSFDDLFTVSSASPANVQSVAIPASGTIYLRVTDTDQGAGNKGLDTVFVDQLYIRSDGGEPPANQPPVAAFTSDCGGLTCGFTDTSSDVDGSVVAWSWDFGDGATSTAQHPSHAYSVAGGYTVTLTVTDDDGATAEATSPVNATEPSPISLSASGYKVRGEHTVDLSWSGAAGLNVDIERDGGVVATTANNGAYTDNTGNKGGRTYRYRVCETAAGSCSNEVSVVF